MLSFSDAETRLRRRTLHAHSDARGAWRKEGVWCAQISDNNRFRLSRKAVQMLDRGVKQPQPGDVIRCGPRNWGPCLQGPAPACQQV